MSTIAERISAIRSTLAPGVELVAVSKFHPIEALQQAYAAGQRVFGESRVQEFVAKVPQMPADVRWHFIGHLQTNKVKQIIGKTALIESVDSLRLLDEIDRRSEQAGVVTRVLLQLHVAAEETKTGFTIDEMLEYFTNRRFEGLRATHLCGVMGMASNTDNVDRIAADFAAIQSTYRRILDIAPDLRGFNTISMGMSHDYRIAMQHGANLVRIGTYIFGEREY
jgi:pyridoxal phosphate enzyme (YggS family)